MTDCVDCLCKKAKNTKHEVKPQNPGSVFCEECQPKSYDKALANNHTYYLAGKKKLEFYTIKDKKTGKDKWKVRIKPAPCVVGAESNDLSLVAFLYATFMRYHDVSRSPDPTDGVSHFQYENGKKVVRVVINGNHKDMKIIEVER